MHPSKAFSPLLFFLFLLCCPHSFSVLPMLFWFSPFLKIGCLMERVLDLATGCDMGTYLNTISTSKDVIFSNVPMQLRDDIQYSSSSHKIHCPHRMDTSICCIWLSLCILYFGLCMYTLYILSLHGTRLFVRCCCCFVLWRHGPLRPWAEGRLGVMGSVLAAAVSGKSVMVVVGLRWGATGSCELDQFALPAMTPSSSA